MEPVWPDSQFKFSDRHGIALPAFTKDWDAMTPVEQEAVLERWETIRGGIPDRIFRFEARIVVLQGRLAEEDDFAESCRINSDIADLASRINDLLIWFRVQQQLEDDGKRHGG